MANSQTPFLYTLIPLALLCAHHHAGVQSLQSFHSIFAFGNSLTDTGNSLLYKLSVPEYAIEGQLPYGETFFHEPTGRLSDGRIVVDFLAQRMGASHFLQPYLGLDNGKINGEAQPFINFAVGGATAQNVGYLNATYNISVSIPYSLDKQLQWFSTLPILKDKDALSKALIYFGEIGVNDYNIALAKGFSLDFVITNFVPNVLNIIKNAMEFLIESGAKYFVVEGGYPFGCTPIYTRLLFINATIDEYGCVKEVHRLRKIHDKLLKELVHNLTVKYNQDVHIIFFDHSKAFIEILKYPLMYGFTNTTDTCYDILLSTNVTEVKGCLDPSTHVNWDGVHYTEAANDVLLDLFYTKGFVRPYPNFLTLISNLRFVNLS